MLGSPPRAWGRHGRDLAGSKRLRFTPTCVGTTAPTWRSFIAAAGSPPRAWGRRYRASTGRIARFGSPPRAWGRRSARDTFVTPLYGSPPRAWGRLLLGHNHIALRFTPTCVGTASSLSTVVSRSSGSPPRAWGRRNRRCRDGAAAPVHPHVRGDGVGVTIAARTPIRFTPTCVGTAGTCRMTLRRARRFTPTCVGTTPRRTRAERPR